MIEVRLHWDGGAMSVTELRAVLGAMPSEGKVTVESDEGALGLVVTWYPRPQAERQLLAGDGRSIADVRLPS